jgi:RNA polymerase sigma factor (sigma-70 family)
MRKSNQPLPKFGDSDYLDLALIASIKRGDQSAFKKMYRKYVPILSRRYFKSFKTQDELKDVVMEIMMKVFENIHRYEMRYTFNAWLTTLARNYVVDYIRSNKTRVSTLNSISLDASYNTDSGENVHFDVPSDEPDAMMAKPEVERQAKLEYIYGVIDRFPETYTRGFSKEVREMFTLYKTSNKKVDDLAALTQMEYDNLRKAFRRGMKNNFADTNGSLQDFCSRIRQDYENSPLRRKRVIGLYLLSHIEGWSLEQICQTELIDLESVTSTVISVQDTYEQAEKDRAILNMYLKENMPYDKIAKVMNMNLNSLKVKIFRLKEQVERSIDVRKAVAEISTKYALEQLSKENFVVSLSKKEQASIRIR